MPIRKNIIYGITTGIYFRVNYPLFLFFKYSNNLSSPLNPDNKFQTRYAVEVTCKLSIVQSMSIFSQISY